MEIACGDFSLATLLERMPKLTPGSRGGLWLVPFKGIPADDVIVPLDLIYLDQNYQVIAVVELFPTYRVSSSTPPAASVLALPAGTIHSATTQTGDQVAFGLSDDVALEEAGLQNSNVPAFAAQENPEPMENEQASAAAVSHPAEEAGAAQPAEAVVEAQLGLKQADKPKSWLQRLLSVCLGSPQDPRKAPRLALPGLSAYFWDGGTPKAHEIMNISDTGLYVVTDERWYPGTLIQMTLKKTMNNRAKAESSISLMARANRWGNDGVGLGFIVRDPRKPRRDESDGVERAELERFLTHIKQEKK
jgi:hypothetical protein